MIFEKSLNKSNYKIVFKELEAKIKVFSNERAVLTIIAPEVRMQNCVLIIGGD